MDNSIRHSRESAAGARGDWEMCRVIQERRTFFSGCSPTNLQLAVACKVSGYVPVYKYAERYVRNATGRAAMGTFRPSKGKVLATGQDRPPNGHRRLIHIDIDIVAYENDLRSGAESAPLPGAVTEHIHSRIFLSEVIEQVFKRGSIFCTDERKGNDPNKAQRHNDRHPNDESGAQRNDASGAK
jgi:hypothetical protein